MKPLKQGCKDFILQKWDLFKPYTGTPRKK